MNLNTAKLKTLSFSSATKRNSLTEEKGSCNTHTLSQWPGEIISVWIAISFIWIAEKYEVWAAAQSCWNKAKMSHNSGHVHHSYRASFSGFLTSSLTLNSSRQTPWRPLLSNPFQQLTLTLTFIDLSEKFQKLLLSSGHEYIWFSAISSSCASGINTNTVLVHQAPSVDL